MHMSLRGPAVANPADVSQVRFFSRKGSIDIETSRGWQMTQDIKAADVIDYASNFQTMHRFWNPKQHLSSGSSPMTDGSPGQAPRRKL